MKIKGEPVKAFDKVKEIIKGNPPNGHAISNQKNKISLKIAKEEIKQMLKEEVKVSKAKLRAKRLKRKKNKEFASAK